MGGIMRLHGWYLEVVWVVLIYGMGGIKRWYGWYYEMIWVVLRNSMGDIMGGIMDGMGVIL
jgi:hypothetical protein